MEWKELKEKKSVKYLLKVWNFLLAQWFFILLGVFIGLAYRFPNFAKQGGTVKAQYSIEYGAVAFIFLSSGLTMKTKDLFANILHWRAHVTVLSTSFLITSAIIYGIVTGIKAAHDKELSDWVLVGMIVTFSCPTTVSSNVIMTRQAHGNEILTLCEVFIGNILGTFITPAIVQMYLQGIWEFGNPLHQPMGDHSIQDLYRNVIKQIGLSVFVPLVVGQIVQNIFPKQVKKICGMIYINKVSSFCLLLIMYQSFSTAFAQHAFEDVSHASVIFIVFFNIGIYLFFTVVCYLYSRPLFIKQIFSEEPNENTTKIYNWGYKILRPFYYNRKDTVAVLLCGPAKTAALGVSLVSSQYGSANPKLGLLLVPLVLYQAEQVVTAQVLVNFMRRWVHQEEKKEDEESQQEYIAQQQDSEQQDSEQQDSEPDQVKPQQPSNRSSRQESIEFNR